MGCAQRFLWRDQRPFVLDLQCWGHPRGQAMLTPCGQLPAEVHLGQSTGLPQGHLDI